MNLSKRSRHGGRAAKKRQVSVAGLSYSSALAGLPKTVRNIQTFRSNIIAALSDVNTGGAGSQGFCFLLNYPSYCRTAAGALAQMGAVADNYANEFKLFDEYKVHSLTLRYVRWYSQSSLYIAANVALDPRMYVATDNDDSAQITSEVKMLSSQGWTIHSLVEPRQNDVVAVLRNEGKDQKDRWLNTNSPSPSAPDAVVPGNFASIKTLTMSYEAINGIRGTFYATWDVEFRGIATGQ
jgi:hypothetical protein